MGKDPSYNTPTTTLPTNATTTTNRTLTAGGGGSSSRRNQWREQLKQNVGNFSDLLNQNSKHNNQQTQQQTSINSQGHVHKKKKNAATEFLPMETDTTKSSIRLKTVTNKNNN